MAAVEQIVGHSFHNKDLVTSAITHPSAVEGRPLSACYERLEFLGDSILGALVAADLYDMFPQMDEGELSRLKISLVSGATLSQVAGELGLGEHIVFGESERGSGARGLRSALENVYEALVGALFLDAGADVAHEFVRRTLSPHFSPERAALPLSPKSALQEATQRDLRCAPEYRLVSEEGPAHEPVFTVVAFVDGRRMGRGTGPSKKAAEAAAALDALGNLGYLDATHDAQETPCT